MKTTTIQIEIPSPPDTHFLLPQEWKGKVKLQEGDLGYRRGEDWYKIIPGDIWQSSLALARLRPRNPQGLPDDVFRKLPMDARALSDDELKRLEEMGGLRELDEKLIYWNGNAVGWDAGNTGINTTFNVYATLHPANYYMELPDSAFTKGKMQEEQLAKAKATLPEGCELVTDPDYVIKEGDFIYEAFYRKWGLANYRIGRNRTQQYPFVARPIAKPQPKFKVGDVVLYITSTHKNGWTIESVDTTDDGIRYAIAANEIGRIDYVHEYCLQAAKLVPWTFDTRPAGMVWLRDKAVKDRVTLITKWVSQSRDYEYVLINSEWSPDGKNNWQPCGNYEPDNS